MKHWNSLTRPLVLASQSPRRRELLGRMGLTFDIDPPAIPDEHALLDPLDLRGSLPRLALHKAADVAPRHPDALVLGCDTIVVIDGRILGKPRDRGDAERMIRELSGREHEVWSGVGLICPAVKFARSAVAVTQVKFRVIPEPEIEQYLSDSSYLDKAGAYGIQGTAMTLVESINGCYYNVVGLPIAATIGLFEAWQSWKDTDQ